LCFKYVKVLCVLVEKPIPLQKIINAKKLLLYCFIGTFPKFF
jgi:hypothetical protein